MPNNKVFAGDSVTYNGFDWYVKLVSVVDGKTLQLFRIDVDDKIVIENVDPEKVTSSKAVFSNETLNRFNDPLYDITGTYF